jgi:hypothetical protein
MSEALRSVHIQEEKEGEKNMLRWLDETIVRAGFEPEYFFKACGILLFLYPLIFLRLIWNDYYTRNEREKMV